MGKICELKIQRQSDREKVIQGLVNSGYKLSLLIKKEYSWDTAEYTIIVEDGEENNNENSET